MKIEELNFTSANNTCLSLRIIAEKVRSGEWTLLDADTEGGMLSLQVVDQNSNVPRLPPLAKRRHLGML